MVLDHVANGAGLIVESAAPLDSEFFRHGDLHALDVVTIPERLHERISEAENHHVVHRPLAQIVVNAKDGGFGEGCMQDAVEFLRRGKIMAEGFFNNDASTLRRSPLSPVVPQRFQTAGAEWRGNRPAAAQP